MNYADDNNNPYQNWGLSAAQADATSRASFIRKTYLHLLGAVVAFCAIEAVLMQTGLADLMFQFMTGNGRFGWLIILGAFMGVSWLANSWAMSSTSLGKQYAGLSLYVIAQAVIMLPLIYLALATQGPGVIMNAALLTGFIFIALTGAVFVSGADFSFMRSALIVGGFAAMGVIVCSALFGFNLGIIFIAAMLLLCAGYILYDTSNVLHHYQVNQHVAAALALFASVALMFWYVLQLLMSLNRR
ncbi:Bax inhibitor-1/YccA family protein [Lacipirellula sp.]|uniref:Bax inhibitor-1/YccA family protein n=1 Tax=Lacipirellula sp. TaxID=2691419 RepID=UPI003D1368F5